jgi:DNA-binding XRE family transcriptional regulator
MGKIKDTIIGVISRSVIHMENQLVSESIELTTKIIEESVAPSLKE